MTTTLFVQIRCKPGTAYNVADEIGLREIHSELYSISGDFDLLLKLHVPSEEDIGRYINDMVQFIVCEYIRDQIPAKHIYILPNSFLVSL